MNQDCNFFMIVFIFMINNLICIGKRNIRYPMCDLRCMICVYRKSYIKYQTSDILYRFLSYQHHFVIMHGFIICNQAYNVYPILDKIARLFVGPPY